MKVPLIIDVRNESLDMTVNGKMVNVPLPFQPYVICENPHPHLKTETRKMIRIPDRVERNVHVMASPEMHQFSENVKQLMAEGNSFHRLPYIEQLYVDREDFVLAHANTNELRFLYVDIEVLTVGDGVFPRAKTAPIIAIGAALNDQDAVIFDNYDKGKKKRADVDILNDFADYVKQTDPDVIVTYNGTDFDIPYIVERMEICDIDPVRMARFPGPVVKKGRDGDEYRFRGRIHFDLLPPARKDQSLFGIKSRGLKNVSKWYGFEAKEFGEDITNTKKFIGTWELREYLMSDVDATRHVGKVYIPNTITLAEMMKVSLESIMNGYPSFIPKIMCGRHYRRLNMVPLDNNKDRYGATDDKGNIKDRGRLFTLGGKYEGAIVDIKKTGYFPDLRKIDYKSMYPSSIRTWNLGPDTTRIVATDDYTGEFSSFKADDRLMLRIPDKNYNKDVTVEIDTSRKGFLKEEIERLAALRTELKQKKGEATDEGEKSSYDSQQIAVKVIMNSIYGYMGNTYTTYGDMATALSVTGMCRWTSKIVIKELLKDIVEIDTDGFVVDREVDYERVNKMIAEKIQEEFGQESFMELEEEPLIDGYFYRMKNYVVRKHNKQGEVVKERHGVAFKSSKQAPVCDHVMETISQRVLDRQLDDQYAAAMNLKHLEQYPLHEFKFRVGFTKNLEQYGDRMSTQLALGIQVEERLGTKVEDGLQVEYYVTKEPAPCPKLRELFEEKGKVKGPYYTISQYVTSIDQLDQDYYKAQMDKIFDIFQWKKDAQLELELGT